ncbi:MAG: sugar-binding protein, partial [Candidatus Hydrogenedentes bacterium]|nr:sugar-binding protein [Candidatus Hydrogenedentota bacterium]
MIRSKAIVFTLILSSALAVHAAPGGPIGIPLKPDPPIAVDGDLGDWEGVPNTHAIDTPEQAVWGANSWTGPEDLHGNLRLAWRQEYLFIAAEVVDETIHQTQRGANIWKGDHIEVYLDAAPDFEANRETFGAGQYQFAISPGNFQNTGDAFTDCPPEAYGYRPEAQPVEGALVASQRTRDGYILEAAIPWAFFGVTPETGTFLRIEVTLSDTDGPEARQESMLALSSATWGHKRSRLIPALLAGTDGVPPERADRLSLFDEVRLQRGEKKEFAFTAPTTPEGKQAVLFLKARLDTERVAGHTPALELILNGEPLSGHRLIDKPLRVQSRNGAIYSMYAGERLTTYYAPDFEKADHDSHYGLLEGVKACEFQLDVTDLIREGDNTLIIENAASPNVERTLVAGEAALMFRTPPPPPKPKAGPPTGPIETYVPRATHETAFDFREMEGSRIEITVGGETFVVESRFSCPEPAWKTGSCDYFHHEREVKRLPEGLEVTDRFTNLTDDNLALMHRHETKVGGLEAVWLAGFPQMGLTGKSGSPQNPTTFGATTKAGIGLLPREDVFRIHVANYAMDGILGLADNNIVLPPDKEYATKWLIVPSQAPDYWQFINAARRMMNANFTIEGGFAFLRSGSITEKWSDELLTNFLNFKAPKYVCSGIGHLKVNGE